MIELLFENLNIIISIIVLVGGTGFGMWKWHDMKIKNAFDEGKNEEVCLNRIEQKADEALEKVNDLHVKMSEEIKQARVHHERLYDKVDSLTKTLNDISNDVSYIRGKNS